MFEKIYKLLDRIRACTIIVLLGGVIILSLIQIVLRYFTSADLKPFAWGERGGEAYCNLGGFFWPQV